MTTETDRKDDEIGKNKISASVGEHAADVAVGENIRTRHIEDISIQHIQKQYIGANGQKGLITIELVINRNFDEYCEPRSQIDE